jgi:superfamily II DNA or RNA helicase
VLVLSRQIKHLNLIADALPEDVQEHAEIVTGQLPRPRRDELIQDLRDGSLRCILGTQLFEEGVDIPRLNRIVLAFPGTDVTVLQKVGRGARKSPGKTETVIYDIVDEDVLTLARQWLGRRRWYRSVGIEVHKATEGVPSGNGKGKNRQDNGDGAADPRTQGRIVRGRFRVARPHRS